MVYLALIALVGGIACGMAGLDDTLPVKMIVSHKDLILYALMFLVGISIGLNRGIIKKIKEYHIRIFVIPAGIIAGSLAGGIVSGLLTGLPLNESAAIASGLRHRKSGRRTGGQHRLSQQSAAGDFFLLQHPADRQETELSHLHRPRRRNQRGHYPPHDDPVYRRGDCGSVRF